MTGHPSAPYGVPWVAPLVGDQAPVRRSRTCRGCCCFTRRADYTSRYVYGGSTSFRQVRRPYVDHVSWPDRSDRIDADLPVFVWRQIADDLAALIDAGELTAGARLPSEADLAESYGVARNTVRRALRELADHERITVLHGKGTYVTR